MRTKIYIIALLSVLTVAVSAQTYGKTYKPVQREVESVQGQQTIQSQQIMMTGNTYNGTVYEPFSTATPSDYSEVSTTSTSEESGRPGHIRKGLIGGPEDPVGPSPVGDALLPLLAMIAAYGAVRVYRRKRRV